MADADITPLNCPTCGDPSEISQTQYGRRDECQRCKVHSFHGRPMVAQEVHDARKHTGQMVGNLWRDAETMYGIEETPGTEAHKAALARVRASARARAHRYIAFVTGLPEPECHVSTQADIDTLRRIYVAARDTTPEGIRDWWKSEGAAWWEAQKPTNASKEAEEA